LLVHGNKAVNSASKTLKNAVLIVFYKG